MYIYLYIYIVSAASKLSTEQPQISKINAAILLRSHQGHQKKPDQHEDLNGLPHLLPRSVHRRR